MVRTGRTWACFGGDRGDTGNAELTSEGATLTTVTGPGPRDNAVGGRSACVALGVCTSERGSANAQPAATSSASAATIRPFTGLTPSPSSLAILSPFRRTNPPPLGGRPPGEASVS